MALDSVLVVQHVHRVPVDILRLPPQGWFEWLNLAASLLVAPIVAIFAARLGAIEGGRQAHRAAVAVHTLEVEDSKRLRDEERAALEQHQLHLLVRRIKGDIRRFEAIPRSLETTNCIDGVMPAAADTLEVACEAFYRQRDVVRLFSDEEFEEEVEFFYDKLFSIRGWLRKWHQQEAALVAQGAADTVLDPRVAFQIKSLKATLPLGEKILERLVRDWPTPRHER